MAGAPLLPASRPGRSPRSPSAALGAVLVLAVVLVLAAVACSAASPRRAAPSSRPAARYPLTLKDDDGVTVTLRAAPARIVTWGPSLTETLFALGAGTRIVGVSGPFDDFPAAAEALTHVGGASGVQPDVERVVSLRPDVVLNAFLGGAQWHQQLRALGIPVISLHASTLDDALHDIRTVGRITGESAHAAALTSRMAADAERVQRAAARRASVTCFLEEGYAPPNVYTVGPGSMEFDLLRRAGCAPVTAGLSSAYPSVDQEAVLRDDPSVYLVATESGVSPDQVGKRPGFQALAAVADGRVVAISSDLMNRPGPRLVQALRDVARLLHPEIFG